MLVLVSDSAAGDGSRLSGTGFTAHPPLRRRARLRRASRIDVRCCAARQSRLARLAEAWLTARAWCRLGPPCTNGIAQQRAAAIAHLVHDRRPLIRGSRTGRGTSWPSGAAAAGRAWPRGQRVRGSGMGLGAGVAGRAAVRAGGFGGRGWRACARTRGARPGPCEPLPEPSAGTEPCRSRRSTRSSRCSTADSASDAEGSSIRAHITSSSRRGAVAPRISPRPACITSA